MESGSCAFSCLPQDFRHSFLQQAFKQLDQRHLLCIVPFVCRPWHTLAVSCSSKLDVKVQTAPAGKSLTSWVQKNGYNLQHLSVSFDASPGNIFDSTTPEQLLQMVKTTAPQLQSLCFEGKEGRRLALGVPLSSLSQLTSLELSSWKCGAGLAASLSALAQLRSLDLSKSSAVPLPQDMGDVVIGLGSKLTQLTNVDLSRTWNDWGPQKLSILLSSLPQLKVLRLEYEGVPADLVTLLRPNLEVPAIELLLTDTNDVSKAAAWLRCSGGTVEGLGLYTTREAAEEVSNGAHLLPLLTLLQPLPAPKLRSLRLYHCELRGHCSPLTILTQLKVLALHECELREGDLMKLSALTGLHELHLVYPKGLAAWTDSMVCFAKSLRYIRQVISKSVAFDQPLFMAFVDLRKAYDSVPRDTLWRILHVYGVHTKLIELLMDLHTGTQAAVRMGGVVSEWFDVHGGVRQGCVIAPLLFNIYMDFVVRQAMAQMPEGCGVKLAYHADGKLERDGCGSGGCVELLSVLLYADDMVLLSPSREELVVMLQVMDKVAASLGLRINASKTEILSIDKDWKKGDVPVQQGPEVVISEGVVKEVSQFKYLGSVLVTDGRLDVELNIRRGKAVGRFKQFEKMWGTKHLSLATKVKCYKAYVLPILLFGSECWSLTKVQSQKLERVHSSCLRSILGVRLSDRHTNEHIRKSCGVATLSAYITANRLRWLGHVGRMEEGRLPHIALFSSLHGDMTRPVGRPRHTWEKCVCADLKVLGQDEGSWEASCQIKSAWRKRLWDLTHPWESQRLVRCRRRTKQAIDKHVERYVVPFSGWEDGGSPVPRWWEPPPAPTRVVLDPAASPPPMCDGSGAGFGF